MKSNQLKFSFLILATSVAITSLSYASDGEPSVTDGRSAISVSEMKKELLALPASSRGSIAEDKRRLARYVENILSNRRAMQAASQTDIPDSAEVRAETEKARREAIARIYIEQLLAQAESGLPPAEEFFPLALERYTANKDTYRVPEGIRVSHILFKVDVEKEGAPTEAEVRAKAEQVLGELRGGADFAKLAQEHSEDAGSARRGGELPGFVVRGKMVPPFEKAAFALPVGELSSLVRTRFGFHIIKVLERRPAAVRPFEEVRDEIVQQLRAQRLSVVRSEIMQPINGTQEVVIDDAFMEALKR